MFIDVCWSCSPKTGVELAVIAFFAPGTVQKSPELAKNAGKMVFSTLEKYSLLKFCTPMQNSSTWIVIHLDFIKSYFLDENAANKLTNHCSNSPQDFYRSSIFDRSCSETTFCPSIIFFLLFYFLFFSFLLFFFSFFNLC